MTYTLPDYIKHHYGTQSADEARYLFGQLQVRIPVATEFYEANDIGGAIIFLNSAACCIRITNNIDHPHIVHDRILQPLFTRTIADTLRIDILPGVHYMPDIHLKRTLKETLKQDDIIWNDDTVNNMGVVFHDNVAHALVIDTGSARRLSDNVSVIQKNLTPQPSKPSIQQTVFGELYSSFEKVFPLEQKAANTQAVHHSWTLCETYARHNKMIAQWQTINFLDTTNIAEKYNKQAWRLAPQAAYT